MRGHWCKNQNLTTKFNQKTLKEKRKIIVTDTKINCKFQATHLIYDNNNNAQTISQMLPSTLPLHDLRLLYSSPYYAELH
jgi:hypothetical protein